MNKTQDKFSLPAVTLSIFAAAAAERLPVCSYAGIAPPLWIASKFHKSREHKVL